jgi:aldose 1-epimerase
VSESFGTTSGGVPVERHVLRNGRLEVAVLSYGGIVQSVRVPDRDGAVADVVLGFSDVAAYEQLSPYFGALVGRYANRIARARFSLDGHTYELAANNGPNNLHGGPDGFDRRVWDVEPVGDAALRLRLESPDGDQGFPGRLTAVVTYTLAGDDGLRIDYAVTNEEPEGGRATVVNVTNHSYFNLAGEGSGSVGDHELQLVARRFTPVDATAIPLPEAPLPVEGTPLDFRSPTPIGARWREGHEQLERCQGYDHNWVLDGAEGGAPVRDGLALAAVAHDPASGRVLETWTDQPGVQFYSGNFLDGSFAGKAGRLYRQGDGFCLETQHWPDSPNRPDFPSTVLRPRQTFTTSTLWRFAVAAEPATDVQSAEAATTQI